MTQYYVTQRGKPVGPWSVEQVLQALRRGEVLPTDYYFDPEKGEWQLVLTSSWVPEEFKVLPKLDPDLSKEKRTAGLVPADKREWFIFRDSRQFGPYSYYEMIKLLQTKRLYDYDFVWSPGLSTWVKLYQIPEFSSDVIQKLARSSDPNVSQVFFRRRYPRVSLKHKAFLHNSKKWWSVETTEVSAGGVGLVVPKTEDIQVRDQMILHLTSAAHATLPPFNALCEVVSIKPYSENQLKLGLSFVALNQDIQLNLKLFTERKVA